MIEFKLGDIVRLKTWEELIAQFKSKDNKPKGTGRNQRIYIPKGYDGDYTGGYGFAYKADIDQFGGSIFYIHDKDFLDKQSGKDYFTICDRDIDFPKNCFEIYNEYKKDIGKERYCIDRDYSVVCGKVVGFGDKYVWIYLEDNQKCILNFAHEVFKTEKEAKIYFEITNED